MDRLPRTPSGKIQKFVIKQRLNEEQKTRARTVLARHHRMLMRVREFPLENSDPPATVLRLVPRNLEE